VDYKTEITEGLVVLDVVHKIQATQANDLACRWNCKAGKCGSCSAEVNGIPKLMCMTRMDTLNIEKPITIEPMRPFRESAIWRRTYHGITVLRKNKEIQTTRT